MIPWVASTIGILHAWGYASQPGQCAVQRRAGVRIVLPVKDKSAHVHRQPKEEDVHLPVMHEYLHIDLLARTRNRLGNRPSDEELQRCCPPDEAIRRVQYPLERGALALFQDPTNGVAELEVTEDVAGYERNSGLVSQ